MTIWILGREYDLDERSDVKALCEKIGECQARHAANDLSLIASTLLGAALEARNERAA